MFNHNKRRRNLTMCTGTGSICSEFEQFLSGSHANVLQTAVISGTNKKIRASSY